MDKSTVHVLSHKHVVADQSCTGFGEGAHVMPKANYYYFQ